MATESKNECEVELITIPKKSLLLTIPAIVVLPIFVLVMEFVFLDSVTLGLLLLSIFGEVVIVIFALYMILQKARECELCYKK